jgi:outer membrane protein assembly factor BamD
MSDSSPEESIALFKQLQAAYPASKYALQSKLEIAYTLYQQQKYDESIGRLNGFIRLYPNHFSTPYAYYLRGVISERKSQSILDEYVTDNAQRDVKSVRNAFNYFLALIKKFPDSKYAEESKTHLVKLRNILARHELLVAVFYTKRDAGIAAINRLKFIIENFPNTPSVPAALHLMAYNYDLLKMKTLATDIRRVLDKSYPGYKPHYSLKK